MHAINTVISMRFKIFTLWALAMVFLGTSCSRDTNSAAPIRDRAEQYATDIAAIDDFLDTHYMEVNPTTFDVEFYKIPENGTQTSIRNQTQYPLRDTLIAQDDINYKLYFIKFREGTQKRPTQVDSVHVAYKGIELSLDVFDQAVTPNWFALESLIPGWGHVFPNFKSGTYTAVPGQPIQFDNYGAGVMFLPSGLGYYNNATTNIPAYSPIIFSFKLIEVRYRDHDRDGILSRDERSFPLTNWSDNPKNYDTDDDDRANMVDIDDDNDSYLTKFETSYVVNGVTYYYPFNGAAIDNPATPNVDERRGIPRKFTGPVINGVATPVEEDFTAPNRLRRHLDNTVTNVNP